MVMALATVSDAAALPTAAPRRILSLNLCADPLLLATADPGQIVALSPYARDPELAAEAVQARRFPMTDGSAEAVLMLKPDLVLASGAGHAVLRRLLARQGARVVDLPRQESLAGIEEATLKVAQSVGHPERGRMVGAALEAKLRAIGRPPGRGRVAAYYQRRGYLTGTGTLIDELFTRVGLVNLARRLHRPALSQISVEEMALARPDFLVMESATAKVSDQGTEMLHHPVLGMRRPGLWRRRRPPGARYPGGGCGGG